ncbi:MAG: TonB family protein [Alphaproteobacteria bacterium]|nr:TonB family protein [Alphaproteobacteria bacterium]
MNIAQTRPRIWTPQVIVLSIIVHALVLYYTIVAFNIVPIPGPATHEPPTFETVILPPKPPVVIEPERIEPRIRPRQPIASPVTPTVEPLRLTPQPPAESTANAGTLVLNQPIEELPVVQGLPHYPRIAQDRQVEGKVRLSITIMPDGSVRDVRVVNARPNGYFEGEAVRAVQGWRYKPSNVIRQNVIVDIDFVLA